MNGSLVDVVAKSPARERVVVNVDSRAARTIGALALLCAACWLVEIAARHHARPDWYYADRLTWSLTVLVAVGWIARGIFLGRPVTATHATAAALCVLGGLGLQVLSFNVLGDLVIAGSGMVLMWPTTSRPARGPAPGVETDRGHPCRPPGAVHDADGQDLPLQRRRRRGAGLPDAAGHRRRRRRPDR